MFDIGFMELLLIGIVALLVLGPDKLPGAIRTGALWFGRAKRSFNNVKSEIEQQINADEIRRQLHNESILGDIEKARKNANKLIKDTQAEIKSTEDSVKRSVSTNGKPTAAIKATTSADEGIPTPPPENYKAPINPETAPGSEESAPTEVPTAEVRATDNETTVDQIAKDQTPDMHTTASAETASQTETPAKAAPDGPATEPPRQESPPSQDIYSTPPTGIVSMQNGKFSAVNDKPKDSDSSSGKK